MGCGCGRKGTSARRASLPNGNGMRLIRPTVGPSPTVGGPSAGASPAQLRALNLANNTSALPPVTAGRLDTDKRRVEKLRRAAIQKRLNK